MCWWRWRHCLVGGTPSRPSVLRSSKLQVVTGTGSSPTSWGCRPRPSATGCVGPAVELSTSAARPCECSSRWAAKSPTSSRGPRHWLMPSKPSGLPRRRRSAGSGGPVPRRGALSPRSAGAGSWRRCPAVDRTRWTSGRARPDRDRRHRHDHPTPPIMGTKPQVRAHRSCRRRAHLSRRATIASWPLSCPSGARGSQSPQYQRGNRRPAVRLVSGRCSGAGKDPSQFVQVCWPASCGRVTGVEAAEDQSDERFGGDQEVRLVGGLSGL